MSDLLEKEMETTSTFWSRKTVLVAGATGFFGGWLVRRLLTCGAHVVALIRSHKPHSQFFMESLDRQTQVEWGSVDDPSVIERIFQRYPIDSFFHAAYGADVHRVLEEPLECFKSSALSTWQILDFLRTNRPDCITVISSTDKVYGRQPIPYREDMALKPLHPYEVAKVSQDYAAQCYGKIFKCPVAVTRCGNFFGGYDFNFTRLIPGVVQNLLQGKAPILRSNGRFTRDFLYIEDAVDAQLLLAQRLSENPALYGEAFNFSYGQPIEVLDIVKRICQLLDATVDPVINENGTAEIPEILLSSDKAKHLLGWKPSHDLFTALERTTNWYREYFSQPSRHDYDWLIKTVIKTRETEQGRIAVQRTYDQTPEAMIVRDSDGTIRYWSEDAERMYGWKSEDVLGQCTHNLFDTKFPAPLASIEKETQEKLSWQGQLIHMRCDGSLITVHSRWNLQHNPQTQTISVIESNTALGQPVSGSQADVSCRP
ncbi:MAG: GDP-mannose 4,6-dehydratase [Nitrospira sp.]|nr:GDP-mannose 4,6-dehydratase [Nitrospira sp.]